MDTALLKKSALLCTVFAISVFTLMLTFQYVRGSFEHVYLGSVNSLTHTKESIIYDSTIADNMEQYLCIPLPKGVTESQIQFADNYIERKLEIYIQNSNREFFESQKFSGNLEKLIKIKKNYNESAVKLTLTLDSIYVYDPILKNGNLYVRFLSPGEVYDKILVIDPGFGGVMTGTEAYGQQEKKIALDVANRLGELLTDSGIKVYFTRIEDLNPTIGERASLVRETQASMVITILANADEKTRITSGTEITYNNVPYTEAMNNDKLAKLLLKELIDVTESKNRGVREQEKEGLGGQVQVAAMTIQIGYLTNKQEALSLSDSSYRNKIAKGIYNGILKVYELHK